MQTAYFFQGNSILLPCELAELTENNEISLDFIENFTGAPDQGNFISQIEQFEVPAFGEQAPAYIVSIPAQMKIPQGLKAVALRQRLPLLSNGMAEGQGMGRLLRAFHIAQWRLESLFCGSCGAKNTDSKEELARLCPVCGRLEYPRIAPAVIVIVTNDKGHVLLAHNTKFTSGIYSLIAGFNEAGESLEETVHREIREEVNIEVRDVRYLVSQPWPFPNSLMLGFSASHAGGMIKADGVEIDDARWWSRDALPELPGHASVSRYLIERWIQGTLNKAGFQNGGG